MKYQVITGHYNSDGSTTLVVRNEDREKREIKVYGHEPYYYIPSDDRTPTSDQIVSVERGYTTIFGEAVKKITVDNPQVVGNIRGKASEHFEADIPYIRRFLIDLGIKSGFKANEGAMICETDDIEPCDFKLDPLVCYIDIEMYEGKISAISFYDNDIEKYVTLALGDEHTSYLPDDEWRIETFNNEKNLLKEAEEIFTAIDPDIITGWYVGEFDIKKIKQRFASNGMSYDFLNNCIVFDLLKGYRQLFKKGSNRLKDVVIEEGISDDVVAEHYSDEMYENDFQKFLKYNKKDVEYLVKLNDKHGLISYFWDLKNFTGIENLEVVTYESTLIDTLLLRNVDRVLPSRHYGEGGKYKGALVFDPDAGIFKNVGVYDFSKYYPNIILAFNITPEYSNLPVEERMDKPKGVLPRICDILIEKRLKYDELKKEYREKYGKQSEKYQNISVKRNAIKYLLNSVYGFTGYPKSRIYDEDVAAEVTRRAREGLEILKDIAEDMGYTVRYGDTDSIMIDTPDIETGRKIENALNDALEDYTSEVGASALLKVKLERIFDRILFKGVKKKYAGHVTWAEGTDVDSMYITGFEAIRRDTSDVTDIAQEMIFQLLLREKASTKAVKGFIRDIVNKVKEGEYGIDEIAIRKTLRKELDEYKSDVDYVRGSKYANKYLDEHIEAGNKVKMLYVRKIPSHRNTDVICYLDRENVPEGTIPDYDKMVDRAIKGKVEDLLDLIGIKWNNIFSTNVMDLI